MISESDSLDPIRDSIAIVASGNHRVDSSRELLQCLLLRRGCWS